MDRRDEVTLVSILIGTLSIGPERDRVLDIYFRAFDGVRADFPSGFESQKKEWDDLVAECQRDTAAATVN